MPLDTSTLPDKRRAPASLDVSTLPDRAGTSKLDPSLLPDRLEPPPQDLTGRGGGGDFFRTSAQEIKLPPRRGYGDPQEPWEKALQVPAKLYLEEGEAAMKYAFLQIPRLKAVPIPGRSGEYGTPSVEKLEPEEKAHLADTASWGELVRRHFPSLQPGWKAGGSEAKQFAAEVGGMVLDMGTKPSTYAMMYALGRAVPAVAAAVLAKLPPGMRAYLKAPVQSVFTKGGREYVRGQTVLETAASGGPEAGYSAYAKALRKLKPESRARTLGEIARLQRPGVTGQEMPGVAAASRAEILEKVVRGRFRPGSKFGPAGPGANPVIQKMVTESLSRRVGKKFTQAKATALAAEIAKADISGTETVAMIKWATGEVPLQSIAMDIASALKAGPAPGVGAPATSVSRAAAQGAVNRLAIWSTIPEAGMELISSFPGAALNQLAEMLAPEAVPEAPAEPVVTDVTWRSKTTGGLASGKVVKVKPDGDYLVSTEAGLRTIKPERVVASEELVEELPKERELDVSLLPDRKEPVPTAAEEAPAPVERVYPEAAEREPAPRVAEEPSDTAFDDIERQALDAPTETDKRATYDAMWEELEAADPMAAREATPRGAKPIIEKPLTRWEETTLETPSAEALRERREPGVEAPELHEIGAKERFRPARRVFEKMGIREEYETAFEAEVLLWEELMKFREEATALRKATDMSTESSTRIFRHIEKAQTPADVKAMTDKEREIAEWGMKFFDDWADRLGIPQHKRRENYVTHIFEAAIARDLRQKYPLDPDLVRALDFVKPKQVFMPFLKARIGKTVGLREDFWAAIEAYEAKALKVYYYEPLLKKLNEYAKILPPNAGKYVQAFVGRMTNRPLQIDREIQQDLKEFGEIISKLPGGKELGAALGRENAGGIVSYNITGFMYEAYMGLIPATAIKNLGQNSLTIAETGIVNFLQGVKWRMSDEGRAALAESLVMRSRRIGYLPGVDESYFRGLQSKRREITMAMFRRADRINVRNAFAAGYTEAKKLGLPHEWCVKRGDEVAAKTQYVYTKLAGAMWSQSSAGRILSVFTTWPENWLELMVDWGTGKGSLVYGDYEKATGDKVGPEGPLARRKQMLRYMMIVALAMYIEHETELSATVYTGWTSLKSFARMSEGQLPALNLSSGLLGVVVGILTRDERLIKKSWGKIRPDQVVSLVRRLKNIASGKKDWLSLFVYTHKKKEDDVEIVP